MIPPPGVTPCSVPSHTVPGSVSKTKRVTDGGRVTSEMFIKGCGFLGHSHVGRQMGLAFAAKRRGLLLHSKRSRRTDLSRRGTRETGPGSSGPREGWRAHGQGHIPAQPSSPQPPALLHDPQLCGTNLHQCPRESLPRIHSPGGTCPGHASLCPGLPSPARDLTLPQPGCGSPGRTVQLPAMPPQEGLMGDIFWQGKGRGWWFTPAGELAGEVGCLSVKQK